jgi:hypothetical protein
MNRFLLLPALAALVAGCAMPDVFGQQSRQPVVADPPQTVVVREIYHETPVVYVDTVYLAGEPEQVQPVYVNEEYNQYNDYNENYVYVSEQEPPRPRFHNPRLSPRDRGQQPRDGSGYDKPRERRDQPNVPVPKPPTKRTYAPAVNDRQKSPVPPTQPVQPTPPKRQAPAQSGSVPAATVKQESPKQAPTPPVDKPVVPASDEVQVGMAQARRK